MVFLGFSHGFVQLYWENWGKQKPVPIVKLAKMLIFEKNMSQICKSKVPNQDHGLLKFKNSTKTNSK